MVIYYGRPKKLQQIQYVRFFLDVPTPILVSLGCKIHVQKKLRAAHRKMYTYIYIYIYYIRIFKYIQPHRSRTENTFPTEPPDCERKIEFILMIALMNYHDHENTLEIFLVDG